MTVESRPNLEIRTPNGILLFIYSPFSRNLEEMPPFDFANQTSTLTVPNPIESFVRFV
jgi:hypothetical protein